MTPKKPKIEEGNVYLIPYAENQYGVGQIVLMDGKLFYFAVFPQTVSTSDPDTGMIEKIISEPIDLFGLTLPLKITVDHEGQWIPAGNFPVVADFPLPAYKYGGGPTGKYMVHDYANRYLREATDVEAAIVPNKTTVSPMHFVLALRALAGLEPWKEFYEEVLPKHVVPYQQIFGEDA